MIEFIPNLNAGFLREWELEQRVVCRWMPHSQLSRQSLWQWNSMESHVIQFSPGIELCEDMNDNVVGVFIPLMMGLSSVTVRADMGDESFSSVLEWHFDEHNTFYFFIDMYWFDCSTHCGLLMPYGWRHRSGSTLAQVMVCCLMAPSHYLNQWWLLIIVALWYPPDSNFTGNAQDSYPSHEFKITMVNYNHISQGPVG